MTDYVEELADTMIRAAEEQVAKAQLLLDQTKTLVDIMRNQVTAHAKQSDEMVTRFKDAGSRILEIHSMLNGTTGPGMGEQGTAQRQQPPKHDPARNTPVTGRPAFTDVKPTGLGTLDHDLRADRRDQEDRAGYKDLQRALAAGNPPADSSPVRRP
jgi:hypothetical protein